MKKFNYIKKAKSETRKSRLFITLINIIVAGLLGYIIGYSFGNFTDFESSITTAVILVIVAISLFIANKFEQRIVQRKLIELVGKNA